MLFSKKICQKYIRWFFGYVPTSMLVEKLPTNKPSQHVGCSQRLKVLFVFKFGDRGAWFL